MDCFATLAMTEAAALSWPSSPFFRQTAVTLLPTPRGPIGFEQGTAYSCVRDEDTRRKWMSFKMIFASAAALAMAAGTPAFAAKSQNQNRQVAASDAGGGAGVKAREERKICRFIDATESRMKRQRLCFTRAEWKKFDEAE
jgi:hypothetical protein